MSEEKQLRVFNAIVDDSLVNARTIDTEIELKKKYKHNKYNCYDCMHEKYCNRKPERSVSGDCAAMQGVYFMKDRLQRIYDEYKEVIRLRKNI